MRRAPIVIASTVAGVAAVLGFQPHARVPLAGLAPASPPRTTSGHGTSAVLTVDGAAIPNRYGTVQVRLTARGGRIVDVAPVQLPQGDAKSAQISTIAAPTLAQQALAAQSAHIDGVSGASYTSAGYEQSLQSAIDQLPAS
jgi:uncharacterized protein with FMN-binding domain